MSTIARKLGVAATLVCLAVPTAALAGGKDHTKGKGRMTGGGKAMGVSGGTAVKVTHGFQLRCKRTADPQRLQVNWSGGNKFHLEDLTFTRCTLNPALEQENPEAPFNTYEGKGFGRDGSYAEWTFTDDGEPGRTDGFQITIWASGEDAERGADPILEVDDDLSLGGNHQAHRVTGSLAR
jgi:hypothetical protein